MEVYTMSIQLGLTPVGKANTRDNYLLVKQPIGNKSKYTIPLFDNKEFDNLEVMDLVSGNNYFVNAGYTNKKKSSNEYRITKMSGYFEDYNLDTGDVVHIQRIKYSESESKYYIWHTKFDGLVLHQEKNDLYRANSDYKLKDYKENGFMLNNGESTIQITFIKRDELKLTKPHKDQPFPLYEFSSPTLTSLFSEKVIYLQRIDSSGYKVVSKYGQKFIEIKGV